MLTMAYDLLAAGPNDIPPTELAPLLKSKLFAKRETFAVILKLWNLEWAPEKELPNIHIFLCSDSQPDPLQKCE
jgi:hypothetical protein